MKNFIIKHQTFFQILGIFSLLVLCIILLQLNKEIEVYPEDYNRAENARVNCEKVYDKDACHVFKREIVKCLDDNTAFSTCITVNKSKLTDFDIKSFSKETIKEKPESTTNSPAMSDHLMQGAGIAIGIKATEALLGK